MNYDILKVKRSSVKCSITRIINWFHKNVDNESNCGTFKIRYENLDSALVKYNEIQDCIDLIPQDETLDTEDRDILETNVCDTLGKMRDLIERLSKPPAIIPNPISVRQQASPQPMVKLPEIKINPFSGKVTEWATFMQLFEALIGDNSSLTNIQKFMYLRSFLRDEPLKIIESLPATHDNFTVAVDLLKKRYANKLSVIHAHFISLLEVNPVVKPNATNLREFVTSLRKNLDLLQNLNYSDSERWELLLIYLFEKRLDFGTRKAFETERDINVLPDLKQFLEFLEKRSTILENLSSMDSNSLRSEKPPRGITLHTNSGQQSQTNQNKSNFNCIFCNQNSHKIYKCEKFKKLNLNDKQKFVQQKRLCFNCLASGHSRNECTSRECFLCSQKHHTLLHNPHPQRPHGQNSSNSQTHSGNQISHFRDPDSPSDLKGQTPNSNTLNLSVVSTKNTHVLLATAQVTIYKYDGLPLQAKVLLDSASQNSFVTDKFVKKLDYIPYNRAMNISGISQGSLISHKMVDLCIHSNTHDRTKFKLSCAVLPNITFKLPQVTLDTSKLNIPNSFKLSDPSFATPSDIDILVGADLYYDLLLNEIYRLGKNLPVLQSTYLGWVIAGNVPVYTQNKNSAVYSVRQDNNSGVSMFVQTSEQNSVNDLIERFWCIEQIPEKPHMNTNDELAENIFCDTTQILKNGSFQVNLPFKTTSEFEKLGDSFAIAKKRFENLERRFQKDPSYFCQYEKFIDEYLSLKHGILVPLELRNENSFNKYFLPHHAVIKESSTTTKLRVVFDGSCKTSSKISLNDVTLKGYQVQPDLYDILCRFRSFKYVLTSDIKKMYRQIQINPSQVFLLNILWRKNPQQPLQCIELQTVTYGTNCAPFLATRVLLEIARTTQADSPLASQALKNQCYVDDIITGVDSIENLTLLYDQLNTVLNSHGFSLHKWCSSSKQFLSKISQENISERDLDLDDNPNKILGLKWKPLQDVLCISVPSVSFAGPFTKRKILSVIAQCYDPLGLLTSVIVIGKLIMQKLWLSKLDWDTIITDQSLINEWIEFIENLHVLSNLKIPRYLFSGQSVERTEIHGFADSSLKAYAACVYIRTVYQNDDVTGHLISSKSRVAPLKVVSLPRLELCAMLLLSQLVQKLLRVYKDRFVVDSVNLWTDSQISLCWINSHSSRWNTFVANRVSEIQDLTSKYKWRHVESAHNPADLPSRGVLPQNIVNNKLWWHGPDFLHDHKLEFSKFDNDVRIDNLPEERKVTLATATQNTNEDFWNKLFSRFSTFSRLQRTVAYILRFTQNSLNSTNKYIGPLSVAELKNSVILIVQILQAKYFLKERVALINGFPITDKNLLGFKLLLDSNRIIRVGGRLENANISFDQKHPILLPSHNAVVSMMLAQEHIRLGHAGAQTVLSNFRLKFWPLNGLRETKGLIRKCLTCFRFRAQPAQQLMADLPDYRLHITRPFQRTGVDYGGPFLIKSSKLRKAPLIKVYIALFVCMVTKAIHIELVTELSTNGYISALKRFISRRGNPSQIFSDNATNFLGARNQLKEIYDFLKSKGNTKIIIDYLSKSSIEFKFIPPKSPHWGGIWESAIKSTKYHLKRLIGDTHFTFEDFYTVLTQIEAILNSRPLCALSNDPNDLQSLTPGHFLIGSSLTSFPEMDVTGSSENRLNVWQRCTHIQQNFWKRWSIEYFNRLQNRPKWMKPVPNLKINDLVLLKEDDCPPLKWPLARIMETFPGRDNKVRVVRIKTQNGNFTRPISKLCLLPHNDNAE